MTDWYQQAACAGIDPDLFFPQRGASPTDVAAAKAVCRGCEARAECLEAGLWEFEGIWGGLTHEERRPLRVGRERPRPPIDHGTNAGYAQHFYRGELPVCRECSEAHAADRNANRQARRTA